MKGLLYFSRAQSSASPDPKPVARNCKIPNCRIPGRRNLFCLHKNCMRKERLSAYAKEISYVHRSGAFGVHRRNLVSLENPQKRPYFLDSWRDKLTNLEDVKDPPTPWGHLPPWTDFLSFGSLGSPLAEPCTRPVKLSYF